MSVVGIVGIVIAFSILLYESRVQGVINRVSTKTPTYILYVNLMPMNPLIRTLQCLKPPKPPSFYLS